MKFTRVLTVVKCHTGGEVNNVVTGGLGVIPGATVLEKRNHFAAESDGLRKLLLFEPRGGVSHCVNFVVPSTHPEADMGYIIAEATEYPAMSGSNTICTATVLLETGILPMQEPVTEIVLEAPAGLIRLRCSCEDGKVTSVEFTNQPAFVYELDVHVELEGVGTVSTDIAWGGMTYAVTEAEALGFSLDPSEARELCELGQSLKAAAAEQVVVAHPEHPEFAGVTQTEFTGPLTRTADGTLTAKNAVVVSPGRLDRSPCGTGTSARLAIMQARGQITVGEKFIHRSILDSEYTGRIAGVTNVGSYPAVIPVVAGQAWITELSQVGLEPTDPFPQGFTLADTWIEQL
jgi:proline racemase